MQAPFRSLAFHQSSERFHPGINNLRPESIDAILRLFNDWGYRFWDGSFPLEKISDPQEVVVTFDDAYAESIDVIERLIQRGITPIVFVPTDYIGRVNSWDYASWWIPSSHMSVEQIRSLAQAGVFFGSHGASHRSLEGISADKLHKELTQSKEKLERITDREAVYLSVPFGRYDRTVVEAAGQCGYIRLFSLRPDAQEEKFDGYVLPRLPIYGNDDFFALRSKLCGAGMIEQWKGRIVRRLAGGTEVLGMPLN